MLKKNLRATYRIVELKSARWLLPLLPRLLVTVIFLHPDPLEFVFIIIGEIGTPVLPVLPLLLLRPVLPILEESLALLLIMKASRPVLLHLAPKLLLPLPEELI